MNKMTLTEMCLLSSTYTSISDSSLLLLEKGLIELHLKAAEHPVGRNNTSERKKDHN